MSDTKYSALLRSLARDYADHMISQAQYRARRRILLKELDEDYNGFEEQNVAVDHERDDGVTERQND